MAHSRAGRLIAGLTPAVLAGATPAVAHGFGQRYDLPLPLSLYLVGAGATVALSFAAAVLFFAPGTAPHALPQRVWRSQRLGRSAAGAAGALAAAVFVFVLTVGFVGPQNPVKNLLVVTVWIIGWVGIAFASAFLGHVWRILNPWDTLFASAERLYGLARPGGTLGLGLRYPAPLGAWPAVALFIGFAWAELIWAGRDVPAQLASLVLAYSLLTWTGMAAFG